MRTAFGLLLLIFALVSTASCACQSVGACAPATFLILDEDALDNGLSTVENLANANQCGFGDPAACVNDDIVTDWTGRTALFSRQPTAPGTQLLIPGGQEGDEGWFMATQGFNSPITVQDYYDGNISDESDLDETDGIFALGNNELNALIGQCVCAVVYDSDISMIGPSEANLQGATLGLIAFQVVNVVPPGGLPESGSSDSLNDVLIELADSADVPALCQVVPLDTEPPVITCPADISVECSEPGGSSASSSVIATWLSSATATDNCAVPTVSHDGSAFFSASCSSTPTVVTFTATDSQGNQAQCTASLTVVDTTNPSLSGVPGDANVECDNVPPIASASASDICDSSPDVTSGETTLPGSCPDDYVLVRTFTATDLCGNQDSLQQTVTVSDTTAPVLSSSPADIIVECDAVPTAATLTAVDNCAPSPAVQFSESTSPGPCAAAPVITRTWTAADACGNVINHVQTITTRDTTVPVLAGTPADAVVECDEPLPTPAAVTATDNCDGTLSVSVSDDVASGACPEELVVTRTYSAIDTCGNMATFAQTITVSDSTAPVMSGSPADTTVECDAGLPASPTVTATDNCDVAPVVTLDESVAPGACADESVVTRTWTATDSCGNSAISTQTISVRDTTAPVMSGTPGDSTVECDSIPVLATVTASDNCDSSPSVTPVETVAPGACADESVITRTWTAVDACGNSANYAQTITVTDVTAPVLAGTPADQAVECDAGLPTPAPVTATDNCDANPAVMTADSTVPGSCVGEAVVTRTWSAVDACGNTASYAQTITVSDTTPPTLSGTPTDTTVECSDGLPAPAAVTASDNCDSSPVLNMSDTQSAGSCADESVVSRVWTAVDSCGNTVVFTQTITVRDTTAPVLVGTPGDVTAECDAIPPSAAVTITDNCDQAPALSNSEVTTPGSCDDEYILTRSWFGTDACGNQAAFTQTITVLDTTAPVLVGTPADTAVECDAGLPATASVTATDNCDSAPTVTVQESTTNGACSEESVVTRTWTALDACGLSSSYVQTISVTDTTAPVLAGTPADVSVECDAVPAPAAVTAADNCDQSPTVNLVETTAAGLCTGEFVVSRTWTAADACGNTDAYTQTITAVDTTPPQLAGTPSDQTIECDAPFPAPAPVTASDNCETSISATLAETTVAGPCADEYALTRTWTAVDSCGQSVSYAQVITVQDTTAPVIAGTPADATLECDVAIPAPSVSVTASDNCDSSPSVTHSDQTVAGQCPDESVVTRTYAAADACGNTATTIQTFTIVDSTDPVLAGTPGDVTVECDAIPAPAAVTATDNCDVSPIVVFDETTAAGACASESIITRVWSAVDACGNDIDFTQTITVLDRTAPALAGTPADETVECDAIPAPATVTATDNCDATITVSLQDTSSPGSCSGESVVTRTWSATDVCGNSVSYTQVITVIDTTNPVLVSVPSDVTVECDVVPSVATVTASDNCDQNPSVNVVESTAAGTCTDEYVLTRTWTALDDCGRSSESTQVITVVDTQSPVLNGTPADLSVECGSAIPPAATVTASDNCDANPNVVLSSNTIAGACQEDFVLIRTWTATDACGSADSYAQTITVSDISAPTLVGAPQDATVECDSVPAQATVTATDNCDGSVAVSFAESTAPGSCPDEYVVTRTWTAADVCGNTATATQTLSVRDSTGPVLSATPADAVMDCAATIPAAGPVTASDNCDGNPAVTLVETTTPGQCANQFVYTRQWTAVDACGNTAAATQTITVDDSAAPVLSSIPADVALECDVPIPAAAQVTASDNCDGNPAVTLVETTTPGQCADRFVLTRQWTAVDACGNTAAATQTITVHDSTAPVLSSTPADLALECDVPVPAAPQVTATDNCDASPTVTLVETPTAGSCADESVLTRTWTASDVCGNSVGHVQTITVSDTTAPILAGTPQDASVECDAVPQAADVTASDNCDANPAVTFAENTSQGTCADEFVLTRQWTAVDACGNSAAATQTITVDDSTAPVLSSTPADLALECDVPVPAAPQVTASDNCDASPTVTLVETPTAGSCADESVLTRTWTASDVCGNSVGHVQTITVSDTTAPILAGIPQDASVECDAVPQAADVTASDNCDANPAVTFAENTSQGTCADEFVLTRQWTAVDACGNSAAATQTITVDDSTAPVLSSTPADLALECDVPVPAAPQVTATDNCDAAPTVTLVETPTAGSCADESVLTRTWTASDVCGNSAAATQTITVDDSTAPVLSSTPADLALECDVTVPAAPQVTATDNCDASPTVTLVETPTVGSCADESVLTRTWTASDVCGNSVGHVQTITVSDTTAPILAGTPQDATVECDAVPAAADVTATDNCDPSPTVTFAESTTEGSCADEYVLTRSWTGVDSCGSTSNYIQTVTVRDTTDPVLSSTPADVTIECDQQFPSPTGVTATDNCDSSPLVTVNDSSPVGDCPSTVTREWTAVDACGNTASSSQTISVDDTTAPTLSGTPNDITVFHNEVPPAASVSAVDNCDPSPLLDFQETESLSDCGTATSITRTWTATDACGNVATHVQVITIVSAPCTCPGGSCSSATFLILDEDAIDNGLSTIEDLAQSGGCGFGQSDKCVNDDTVTDWTKRTPLFSRQPAAAGTQILIPGGQVEDEGWFVATQGFNSPITVQDFYQGFISDESDLDETEGVIALRNDELEELVGQCVCAVVYDSDISMIGATEANLQGDTLGLTAFKVIAVLPPGSIPESGSGSSLNDVLIELADPADVPGLCQIQTEDCDDNNSCTIDSCDSNTGFCAHTFESNGENCSATIGTEVTIDCAASETTICYQVYTSNNPELSHESICVPPGVAVSGTGSSPCTQTEHGRDGSIEYNGTVFKFECNGDMAQPYEGEFCLTFDGIFEISEDNLAWVKRGQREEETRTLGISACGSPPVVSDICTSTVTIVITIEPSGSKSARGICSDSALRSQLAEVADVPLIAVTVVRNEDDEVIATFMDSVMASASEAALAIVDRVASDDVPSCLRGADNVQLIDVGGSTLYETSVSTDASFSTDTSFHTRSQGTNSDDSATSNSSDNSSATVMTSFISSIWVACALLLLLL